MTSADPGDGASGTADGGKGGGVRISSYSSSGGSSGARRSSLFPSELCKTLAQALGPGVEDLEKYLRLALILPPTSKAFRPIPEPRPGDWLAEHPVKGQTFAAFKHLHSRAVPHSSNRTVYILPLGTFRGVRCPDLETVAQFATNFFHGVQVEVLDSVDPKDVEECIAHRVNEDTGRVQYLTRDIMEWVQKDEVRATCGRKEHKELVTVVLTMADLYPRESWNFVYGIARKTDGVGVWSFARLDPAFPDEDEGQEPTEEERRTILLRSVRILLHELAHLFGLKHCVYLTCLMNGANHEEEMDRQPLHLCPICLRKLQHGLQFNVMKRYRALLDLYEEYGFEEDASWMEARITEIEQFAQKGQ